MAFTAFDESRSDGPVDIEHPSRHRHERRWPELVGLMPVMLLSGSDAEVMKRLASPRIGGLVTPTLLTLVIVPVAFVTWRLRGLRREGLATAARAS